MTPKQLIERYMPDPEQIRSNKYLKVFGPLLTDPGLWFLNRHSVAKAFFVGLLCAFIPVPFQMVLAAGGAILMRANLPVSVALVWLTNPLTMPPMFYLAYKVGAWASGIPEQEFSFELSLESMSTELAQIWEPFLLGCGLVGVTAGIIGYFGIHLMWRLMVTLRWRNRKNSQ